MNVKILTYKLGPPKDMEWERFEVKSIESLVSWVRFLSTSTHTLILSRVRSHVGNNR